MFVELGRRRWEDAATEGDRFAEVVEDGHDDAGAEGTVGTFAVVALEEGRLDECLGLEALPDEVVPEEGAVLGCIADVPLLNGFVAPA